MKEVIKVKGMSCKHCVSRVEEGLNSLKGMNKVKVNLKKEEAQIKYDESLVTKTEIINKVREVGYEVEV